MTNSSSPRIVTSRCRIVYRQSQWRVHHFKIISGDAICNVAVLRMEGSLLLWLGGGREPVLSEIALGMAGGAGAALGPAMGPALSTALLGAEGAAAALARRLAVALRRPVYVCTGTQFDRFTLPLVERGLMAEIKSRPECF